MDATNPKLPGSKHDALPDLLIGIQTDMTEEYCLLSKYSKVQLTKLIIFQILYLLQEQWYQAVQSW